jgi:hypothetical protein
MKITLRQILLDGKIDLDTTEFVILAMIPETDNMVTAVSGEIGTVIVMMQDATEEIMSKLPVCPGCPACNGGSKH